MVFGRFFGGENVDTKYSFAEVVRRLHTCTEYLNSLIKEYSGKINPAQRAATLGKILFQMFRFHILEKKLVAAYLKMQAIDISNAPVYFLNNPQQQEVVEGTYKQIEKNLKGVVEEQSRQRLKSHYLRRFARNLISKAKASRESVEAKIATLQKQQQMQAQQQLELKTAEDLKKIKTVKPPKKEEEYRKSKLEQWRRMEALKKAAALSERENVKR